MYCPKCGTNNDAGTVFCENCGTRIAPQAQPNFTTQQPYQPQYQQPYQPQYQQLYSIQPPEKKKSRLPLILGMLVLVIIIAVVCYFLLNDSNDNAKSRDRSASAEDVAISFVKGLTDNDPDQAIDAVYPEMDGIEKEIREQSEALAEDMEENNIVCDNHRVVETEECEDDIPDAEEYLADYYNAPATIDELKMLTVRVDRTSGSDSDTRDINVYVAKIDGEWYVIRTE